VRHAGSAIPRLALHEISSPCDRLRGLSPRARDKLTLDPVAAIRGDTMVITEIGYLFLTLSAVAVLLFCWLGFASLTSPRRDK
jgi:hypothetical protein